LLYSDVAELTWSNLVAAGCVGNNPDIVSSASKLLLSKIQTTGDAELRDGYVATFIAGLLLASGVKVAEVDDFLERARQPDEWYSSGFGLHIEPWDEPLR
jgi:hypothetical protein